MMKQFKVFFSSSLQKLSEEKFQLVLGQSLLVGNMKGPADLKVPSDSVSRKHLYIALDGNGNLLVCDAGSSNGSFVGNRKLETNNWHLLASNEKISLGQEITCEIVDDNFTLKQPPPLPQSSKPIKELGRNLEDDNKEEYLYGNKKTDPRININFEPNIQVPNERNSSDTKTVSLTGLVLVGALICAALTNPSKQEHLEAISEKYPNNPPYVEWANKYGYLNLVVCSIVKVNPEIASVGIFKNIIFVNPEKFEKKQ